MDSFIAIDMHSVESEDSCLCKFVGKSDEHVTISDIYNYAS